MNRILFEPGEIADGIAVFGGARAEHVRSVLHGEVGQILKTGEVNGKIGTGEILELGETVRVRVRHDGEPLRPWVDLVLAPPRPRILKRLLPQLAALGVGQIVLVGAQKVEKDFWGATLLKEANYRPLLIDGLMQGCVSSLVPTVETRRNFRRFVTDELETRFPTENRLVAHPYEQGRGNGERGTGKRGRLVLAIGPEGGWTDEEVARLEAQGFSRYSLGPRILRTDTATVALLAQLMLRNDCSNRNANPNEGACT